MPLTDTDVTKDAKFILCEGLPYATWAKGYPYAWEYAERFLPTTDATICNMSGYENAVKLQQTIGM